MRSGRGGGLRRSSCSWGRGSRRGCRTGSSFAAQDLEHHSAASRTFAFDGSAPVFHNFFNGINDFFFGFALNTVSFGHKYFLAKRLMRSAGHRGTLRGGRLKRQLRKEIVKSALLPLKSKACFPKG